MSFPQTTIQAAIYSRLTADTGSAGIVTLLGSATRIMHALENAVPTVPSLQYFQFMSNESPSAADKAQINEQFFQFSVYASNYNAIVERLYRLLHNQRLSAPSDAGAALGTWVWSGPDLFDEELQIGRKDVRFRFFVVPKSQAPI